MIIRIDDVSPNTDPTKLDDLLSVIDNFIPESEVLLCVNFFAKFSHHGAVYPNLPLKNQPLDYFFNVDRYLYRELLRSVASHGLWHLDHTKISPDLAEASILTSCRLLRTNTFVPPFNKWDFEVERICKKHGINLVRSEEEGWRSMEHNDFDPHHPNWYMHPWRWGPSMLKEYFMKKAVAS